MVLGFGRWAVKQALKDKTKTITIKPGTKFPGQKTVKEHKRDVSHKKYIDAIRNEGDKITSKLKKSADSLKKLTETLKKQKKILDD